MGYLEGFGVTFKKLFEERVTDAYTIGKGPKAPKADRQHGRHVLNRYEDGMEKCIGCELCAGVCPARCIYVRGADNPPDDPVSPGERYGFVYEINYLRCIHCDLCVEACPPRPSPSRRCSSSPSRTAATPCTRATNCWWTTRACPRSSPGKTGVPVTSATRRHGCGPR